MKQHYLFLIGILAFVTAVGFSAFKSKGEEYPVQKISKRYHDNLDRFKSAVNALDDAVKAGKQDDIREQFKACKDAYKAAAFLMDYFDPQFVKDFINGAPLPTTERKAPRLVILQPEGLQILEEEIFAEEPDLENIAALTANLRARSGDLLNYQKRIYITDRHVFEAGRKALISIFSLGGSGFDSPVLARSLTESKIVMNELKENFAFYDKRLREKSPEKADKLKQDFKKAVIFFEKHTDFEKFPRAEFLREHINPLFSGLLDAHLAMEIETASEVTSRPKPINYKAQYLFSEDLLNPYFFTELRPEDDSKAVRELGQMLFYDPVLSSNLQRSCASCHQPEKAFTDGEKKSVALDFAGTVSRNAPTLINSVYAERFFYDLRVEKLEQQFEHVVVSEKEFHTDYQEITERLGKSEEYKTLFTKAFPRLKNRPITKYSVSTALASYVLSLRAQNSPFDRYARGESETLDEAAIRGFDVFMGKGACGTCHFAPTFSGLVPPYFKENESEVLGVPASDAEEKLDDDLGRYHGRAKEKAPIYRHAFKTVSVRNAALTAPYMHNGAYKTLEEVVEFYNKGGGAGLGFDLPNQTLPPDPLDLTEQEKADLIAFMKSLTDAKGLLGAPERLPSFEDSTKWNKRKIGGEY